MQYKINTWHLFFYHSFRLHLQQRSPSPVSVAASFAAYNQLSISRYSTCTIISVKDIFMHWPTVEKLPFHFYWIPVIVSHFCLLYFAFMFSPCCIAFFGNIAVVFCWKISHYSVQSHCTNIKKLPGCCALHITLLTKTNPSWLLLDSNRFNKCWPLRSIVCCTIRFVFSRIKVETYQWQEYYKCSKCIYIYSYTVIGEVCVAEIFS